MDANFAVEVADQNEDEKYVKKIEKSLADQVIDLYEKCLQSGLIISTSFKNVIQNNLDSKTISGLLFTKWRGHCIIFLDLFAISCLTYDPLK